MAEQRIVLGTASVSSIYRHLMACDADFVPPLSKRADVAAYAAKIYAHATTFERWEGDVLAGLAAAYFNRPAEREAFLTSLSVLPSHRRRGLGALLLEAVLDYALTEGWDRVRLEVHRDNRVAFSLYSAYGFVSTRESEGIITMVWSSAGALGRARDAEAYPRI